MKEKKADPLKKIELETSSPVLPVQKKKWKQRLGLAFILCFLFILLLTIYEAFLFFQKGSRAEALLEERVQVIESLQQRDRMFVEKEFATINSIQQSQYHQQTQVIENALRGMSAQHSSSEEQWTLLKASYYLQLAQINAIWAYTPSAVLSLLSQADNLLKTLDDPQIVKIRQSIAQEMSQTQALGQPDLVGLLSKLDGLKEAILNWSIQQAVVSEKKNAGSLGWQQGWQSSLNFLKKLVVIRHQNEPEPLSSLFGQEQHLKQNLFMSLQQSQWAILHENCKVYLYALSQAAKTLESIANTATFSEATQKQAQIFLQEIQALQQNIVLFKRPSVQKSLELLHDFIQDKNLEKGKQVLLPAPSAGAQ